MRRFGLAAGLAACACAANAQPAKPMQLSPAVKKDLQCFIIYTAAAGVAKDEQTQQAAGYGTMYYLGRLDVSARSLDLVQAVRQESAAMEGNPETQRIGQICGEELKTRGQALMSIGQSLQGKP